MKTTDLQSVRSCEALAAMAAQERLDLEVHARVPFWIVVAGKARATLITPKRSICRWIGKMFGRALSMSRSLVATCVLQLHSMEFAI